MNSKLERKIRKFLEENSELRDKQEYSNSHEANTLFSPAYDLLKLTIKEIDNPIRDQKSDA